MPIRATLLAAAVTYGSLLLSGGSASALWHCTARSAYGSNWGWGENNDRGAARMRAMNECRARGGGCRPTGCDFRGGRPPQHGRFYHRY